MLKSRCNAAAKEVHKLHMAETSGTKYAHITTLSAMWSDL